MILALDPGLRTGWAMSDGRTGTIDLHADFSDDRGRAMCNFAAAVNELLFLNSVRLMLIERPMGKLVATMLPEILTARAHEEAWRLMIPRHELTVPTIRKAVCGNARAKKKEVMPAVKAAGWDPRNLHEADAIAVLLAGIEKAKTEKLA